MRIGLALGQSGAPPGAPAAPPPPSGVETRALFLGQSEIEYIFNTGATYRVIAQPVPGDGNLVVYTQAGSGAPVRTVVNATTVAAGEVNPAMAAMSAFLAHARPGYTFVVGDAAVPGTGRYALANDANTERSWSDFMAVVDAIEADHGTVGHLIECWYNADATTFDTGNAGPAFWPFYFGQRWGGGSFTLGTDNPDDANPATVDHCLWDAAAAPDAKGRGVFTRAGTSWHMLTPMPFYGAPDAPDPAWDNYQPQRLSEPVREYLHTTLAADDRAQSVRLRVGPSAHLCRFGGLSTGIHPDRGSPDGQVLFMWPFALALLRASGVTVNEPEIVGIEGPSDGSHVDVTVSLPNGGTLTTLRIFRGETADSAALAAPQRQPVTGFEITRGGTRRPVVRTDQTAFPASQRGTVTITDTGSGTPRRGRVRIVPETPFAFGDSVSYLRGQASALLLKPRDMDALLYRDMLMEHVPALYDAGATYPFEGIAVRPYQAELMAPVAPPAFAAQSTRFNGTTSRLNNASLSIAPSNAFTLSVWFYSDLASWAASRRILQLRTGTTIRFELVSASSRRMSVANLGTGVTWTSPTNTFDVGRWHHLAISVNANAGTSSFWQVAIDGGTVQSVNSPAVQTTDIGLSLGTITQADVGNATWSGDIGHLWMNIGSALDLTASGNLAKFIAGGAPVNPGPTGALVTGSTPTFYLDGGASMTNLGTGGTLAATALAAGAVPALP